MNCSKCNHIECALPENVASKLSLPTVWIRVISIFLLRTPIPIGLGADSTSIRQPQSQDATIRLNLLFRFH